MGRNFFLQETALGHQETSSILRLIELGKITNAFRHRPPTAASMDLPAKKFGVWKNKRLREVTTLHVRASRMSTRCTQPAHLQLGTPAAMNAISWVTTLNVYDWPSPDTDTSCLSLIGTGINSPGLGATTEEGSTYRDCIAPSTTGWNISCQNS